MKIININFAGKQPLEDLEKALEEIRLYQKQVIEEATR